MMYITFTLQSTADGSLLTGKASDTTVYLSKDFGTYTAATNAVAEIGRGEYKLELTSSESSYTTELHYQPVCSGAQTNIYAIGHELATTSGLSLLESHGDTTWATATGFAVAGDAMTLTSAYDAAKQTVDVVAALESYGTAKAADIPGVESVQEGLATSAEITALQEHGDTAWAGATAAAVAQAVLTTPADNGKANTLQNALRGILGTWSLVDDTLLIKTAEGVTVLALTVARSDTGDITGVTI